MSSRKEASSSQVTSTKMTIEHGSNDMGVNANTGTMTPPPSNGHQDLMEAKLAPSSPPSSSSSALAQAAVAGMNPLLQKLLNTIDSQLVKHPIMAQWASRRAFLTAQGHVLAVLLVAYIVNNWPVSYPREENHSDAMFWCMCGAMGVATAFTLKHKPSTRGVQLLSRAQTEEWKGWMQFVFIMYHYYRNRSIYNEIRVLVSAYVWMTGFGNFLYFDKTQDFSWERAVSMWVRINYFPLMLSLFLSVKLELYYVVPLHTAGFFMTMATCYGAKLLREKLPQHLETAQKANMAAIGIMLVLHIIFFETSLSETILGSISHEYYFRFSTDKYSAWVGVLSGFLWSRFQAYMQWCYGGDDSASSTGSGKTSSITDDKTKAASSDGGDGSGNSKDDSQQPTSQSKLSKPFDPKKQQAMQYQRGAGLALLLLWYFGFGTETDKHVYNPQHPFVFWMPVAGWLLLRNSSKYLTELHSTVLEFIGRITLETYVLQFHVFMCQNVQHIPVVIPGSGPHGFFVLKFANMLVTGVAFVGLSWYAREATIVTQDAVKELVTAVKKRIQAGRDDAMVKPKPSAVGIIEEPHDMTPLKTPQKDKKDEEP